MPLSIQPIQSTTDRPRRYTFKKLQRKISNIAKVVSPVKATHGPRPPQMRRHQPEVARVTPEHHAPADHKQNIATAEPPDALLTHEQREIELQDVDDIQAQIGTMPAISYNPPHTPTSYQHILQAIWPNPCHAQWENKEYLQLYIKVRATGLPNHAAARIPVPSALNIPRWRALLSDYHDTSLVDYLEYGWPADYTGEQPPVPATDNHREDPAHLEWIQKYVRKELSMGALLGPFSAPPFTPWAQTSPMMTRPKKNTTERRVIVDLSFPRGASVNAGIRSGQYQGRPSTYTLPGIMDLAQEVSKLGTNCFLWSSDLARAYRQLRTCPLSVPLLGITLDGATYFDIAPPFGCRTSSMACARTTNAVVYLLRRRGHFVLCYLDDFVGVALTKQQAQCAYADMLQLADELGLQLAYAKCTPPALSLEWLGYHISSAQMTVTIPEAKLAEVVGECAKWNLSRKVSRKDLQRLVGRLQYIARCVLPARCFMNRILAALRQAPFRGRHQATVELLRDIRWFTDYAQTANGLVLLPQQEKAEWLVECDSSLRAGGAFSKEKYFSEAYNQQVLNRGLHITQLEALNLVAAVWNLAPDSPHNYMLTVNTDNQASQTVLSSGAGRDPILCACARALWRFAAINSCTIKVVHKPGKDLVLADALSRQHFDQAARVRAEHLCKINNLVRVRVNHDVTLFDDIL